MAKHNRTLLSRRHFLKRTAAAAAAIPLLPARVRAEEAFTFAQICDTQLGFGGYEEDIVRFKQAVRDINASGADFALICGDLINETESDQAFADFNRIKDGFDIPCYCVPGNHDIGNTPTHALLNRYRETIGRDRYAFAHKGLAFIAVNTQLWKTPLEEETEKQDTWLNATLTEAAGKKQPIIIFGHYPLFIGRPDEEDGYYNLPPACRAGLISRCRKYGAAAVLAGHTHKNIIREHAGMQLISSATTSRNFDNAPCGYRLWRIEGRNPWPHTYTPLTTEETAAPG
jgi:serine/threonine-protein phosphatase CPPED1